MQAEPPKQSDSWEKTAKPAVPVRLPSAQRKIRSSNSGHYVAWVNEVRATQREAPTAADIDHLYETKCSDACASKIRVATEQVFQQFADGTTSCSVEELR